MKKIEVKKPTWAEDNSKKTLLKKYPLMSDASILKRVKQNGAIAKILRKNGWKFWDAINIVENGYTLSFVKKNENLQKRNLYFSWYWDNNGGDDFFVGEMSIYFDYFPSEQYWHPGVRVEIRPVLERFMKHLPTMEKRLIEAAESQSVIE